MPQYSFKCKVCKKKFDEIAKETSTVKCPKCGGTAKRTVTAANFIIKGYSESNGYFKDKEK